MLASTLGGIGDVSLDLNWNAATLRNEIDRCATVPSEIGAGRERLVANGHGGTARFSADFLATRRVGAAAACLDASPTPDELRNASRSDRRNRPFNFGIADLQIPRTHFLETIESATSDGKRARFHLSGERLQHSPFQNFSTSRAGAEGRLISPPFRFVARS
jgi:hypothetical protein